MYDNNIKLDNQLANLEDYENEGVKISKEKITSNYWKKCFPSSFVELVYEDKNKKENINYTGFYLLSDLIKSKTSTVLTIGQVRLELLQEYLKYLNKYESQIIDILISEGKKTLGDQVKAKTMDFTHFLYNEDYYITNLDAWLLLEKYKIPSIFISIKPILQSNNDDKIFVAYGEKTDELCFIVTSLIKTDIAPKYKLIQNSEDSILFSLKIIEDQCLDSITNAFENKITLEEFLQTFSKDNTLKKKVAKKRKDTIILQKEDDDPIVEIEVNLEDVKKDKARTKKQQKRGVVISKKNKKRLLIIEEDE